MPPLHLLPDMTAHSKAILCGELSLDSVVDMWDSVTLTVEHCIMDCGKDHLRGHNATEKLQAAEFSEQSSCEGKQEV